jgi:glutathione synthase/RimK-type ligase-like ATP-grasp enzyme
MRSTQLTILTEKRYINPEADTPYNRNILQEDQLVRDALEKRGLKVERCSWDDPRVDWSNTDYILFRSTWDYFDRFPEFFEWIEKTKAKTTMINPYEVIQWNLDKHYLNDLEEAGIHVPPSIFIESGNQDTLARWVESSGWNELILKPVVSGAARHTYRFQAVDSGQHEDLFRRLIAEESMMIQEFQAKVPEKGEVAFMVFGGRFTHAIIKKAKKGDFRVQDDFGGTVHHYEAEESEISFAENVVARCGFNPVYARVDAIWDNSGQMAVSELELIEPELWFRFNPDAANRLAEAIINRYF